VRRALVSLIAATALTGCTLEPHYVRPAPATPATWPVGAAYPPPAPQTGPALTYRDIFRDPHLQAVIERALANNQNLRVAMANIEIARAQYRVQRSELFPQIGANGTATESRGRVTTLGPNGAPTARTETVRSYAVDIGLTSFEIDLFGRLRSLSHAAQERYLATESAARAARLALVGEVADAYLAYAADNTDLAVARNTVASATRTVELTQARLTGGVAPGADLSQAQTLLQQARSDVAALTTQVAQDRNALELLEGAPVPDADLPPSIEAVDGSLGEVPAGLDSRILLRRPDVLQAEFQLRAANAQIGAARAAFFPTINLTGLAGFASPALSSLFASGNFHWQAQGGVSLPIFAGGANLGNLALARGQRNAAVAQYQLAIQTAFREVADALARRGTIDEQMSAQQALLAAATTSYNLSVARYKEGIDPYLNALDTQRTLYAAQRSLTATRLIRAENLVALYQTIGGDPLIEALPPPGSPARP